jgi:RimJ/RimL family protein N-acetyltransferase
VVLRDDWLALRPWHEDDALAVLEACQDPEIQYWIPVTPRPYTEQDAQAFVSGALDLGPYQFAVEEAGRLVGSIGMGVNEAAQTGHIGYWCVRHSRGRGITTHALRMLCDYAFKELALERLDLITDPDNLASQRVAQSAGFQREGVLRSHVTHPDGRRRDSVIFSLLPANLCRRDRISSRWPAPVFGNVPRQRTLVVSLECGRQQSC